MAGILQTVNARTQLVGQNRLELLTFELGGNQSYGINVFKIKEALQCPRLTSMPNLHPYVKGIAHIRGQAISVIDLSLAIGGRPITDLSKAFIIISEFNRTIQGFLVSKVNRIVNMNWEDILPPPQGSGKSNYLTAVTTIDKKLVEILDVEKILSGLYSSQKEVSSELIEEFAEIKSEHTRLQSAPPVLIADDSAVARKQLHKAMEDLGFETILVKSGREALDKLKELSAEKSIEEQVSLVISDVEMPEMDGYTLTAEIRQDQSLNKLHIILHTSLSGVFNHAMIERVGADQFIAKFNPTELGNAVKKAMKLVYNIQ